MVNTVRSARTQTHATPLSVNCFANAPSNQINMKMINMDVMQSRDGKTGHEGEGPSGVFSLWTCHRHAGDGLLPQQD